MIWVTTGHVVTSHDTSSHLQSFYECVAMREHGDGEAEILASCGIAHDEPVDIADCVVASRWTILRAMSS